MSKAKPAAAAAVSVKVVDSFKLGGKWRRPGDVIDEVPAAVAADLQDAGLVEPAGEAELEEQKKDPAP